MKFLFLGAIIFIVAPLFSQSGPKNIDKEYRNSIVKIYLYDKERVESLEQRIIEDNLCFGSGFIVSSEGYLFTSKFLVEKAIKGYIIADWIDDENLEHNLDLLTYVDGMEEDCHIKKVYAKAHASLCVEVTNSKNNDSSFYEAEVVVMANDADGAILKITKDLDGKDPVANFQSLPLGDSQKISWGQDVVVLGYSNSSEDGNQHLLQSSELCAITAKLGDKESYFDHKNTMFTMNTHAVLDEAMAGSPVINKDGKVIGIVSKIGFFSSTTLIQSMNDMYNVALYNKDLLQILIKNGLKKDKRGIEKIFSLF